MHDHATLDPSDWREFRELSHQMLDTLLDDLQSLREQLAWREAPESDRVAVANEILPIKGQGEAVVFEQFVESVMPYTNGNRHPRFLGWVQGSGFPYAVMADMLASGINPHMAGLNQMPAVVEQKVIDWLKELMGFPASASGLLLSGGSMANFTGLAVARQAKAGFDVRREGLQGEHPQLVIYGSRETHGWANKAANMLGFGASGFRQIECNEDYTINLSALRAAVSQDVREGRKPIAVLASAGTVNTGAIDDMDALADFCEEQDLWLHVDGAFGALVAFSPKLRHLVKGMERADSLAFDLHKWTCLPFEIACVLIRDEAAHLAAFASQASYLGITERGVIAGGLPFADRGIELTRSFKALKAWMSFKAYGIERFAAMIEKNVSQARYLESLVEREPKLELLAPVSLNVVCFRFNPGGLAAGALNDLNLEIMLRLQERGIAIPSHTILNGRFALRPCMVNHRTEMSDMDALVEAVLEIGAELVPTPISQ